MYSQSKRPILCLTVVAIAMVEVNRAVGFNGDYAAAGGYMAGVSDTSVGELADELAIDVLGTSILEANGAIAVGDLVEVAADGKFITKAAGKAVARAITAAPAAGAVFEALLLPATT